ncbi:GNAT family N-acetyltransferase [Kaistia adipata]|uniref:GNAT family N-acetyltransferase n=1 Tax=Kaistia adipata TaxID=166954 RepID=UPI0003FC9A3D|nr:GNAT family N-acetyltransferase [Kaistia adipata]
MDGAAPTNGVPAAPRLAEENPFYSDAILNAARDHLGDDRVRVVRLPNILVPIRPTRLGHLVPAIATWVHRLGPLGTPRFDAGDPAAAATELIAAMDGDRPGRRILEFPYLPLDGAVASALRKEAERQGRPVTILDAHRRAVLRRASTDVAGGMTAKKRKELARQRRRLGEMGALTIEHVTAADALPGALADFFALEASGWKGRRGTALALRPAEKAFAEAAVAEAGARGDVAIHAIRLDGKAIAMLVSFRSGDTAVTWKIAYDEALGRYSPGVHVMLAASEWLQADPAIAVVDSLAIADHPMVDHLWPDRLAIGMLVIGPRGGSAAYRLGIALARLELRLRPLARRAVHALRKKLRRSAAAATPAG